MNGDEALLDRALDLLRRNGIEGEVYVDHSTKTRISVHQGRVESLVERHEHGAGVRVFHDGRVAFAFSSDLTAEGLARAIETAKATAPYTKQDEANVLPEMTTTAPDLINADRRMEHVPITEKIEIAKEVERAARAESPKIQRTRDSSYEDYQGAVFIANTRGARIHHQASRCYAGIELAATEGGSSQTGVNVGWALGPAGLDPSSVGREAARRGLRKLGARQPDTARTSVVLDPEAAALLLEAFAGLFSADSVLKEKSPLASRVGEPIASPCVTLIDDSGIAGGCSSAPVDGEGTRTQETVLIDRGVLRGFLHSAFTARKMHVPPTGNGVRGGYTGSPEPSPTNIYLRPTGIARESLLRAVDSGIYITDLMGLHTIDGTTGDFSLGASGLSIEGGVLGGALDRMAISGNALSILKSIEAVATDLTFLVNGGGATVLLRDISISGAGS